VNKKKIIICIAQIIQGILATIAKFVQNAREITTWLEGYLINYGIMA